MDTARYVVALMLLVSLPPGLLLWLAIHPFARFWRRLGPTWTYVILSPFVLALAAATIVARETLVGFDLGTNYTTIAVAVVSLAVGATLAVKRRRYLTTAILVGLPELSEQRYPGTLLNEGIYARIRHPRYVEVSLWALANALFANYVGTYLLVLLSTPVIYLIVVLEERELNERLGDAYEEYCRKVPRFLPRFRARS